MSEFNWFVPGTCEQTHSWKKEIPASLKRANNGGGSRRWSHNGSMGEPTTVLFVPNSNNGILLRNLEQREPLLSKLSGYTVRLVESSGSPLARMFSLDLSNGVCHRTDCVVCVFHNGKGSSKCRKNNVVYESSCNVCKAEGSSKSTYIGETGRSLYERSLEHLADAASMKQTSHIWRHWATCHPDMLSQPDFTFKVVRVHKSCLDRQIHEGVRIATDGFLNAKAEWRQN